MTKKIIISAILILCLTSSAYAECTIEAYFSPYEDIEGLVVDKLKGAGGSIHCSLYGITNNRITEVLINRVSRGIDIKLCLDKTQSAGKYSTHRELKDAGAEVVIKNSGTLEHNKFCVIDDKTVIMGSWNFSNSAQKQDNSIVVILGCDPITEKFNKAFMRIYIRDKRK
jgi:phosphatidylserine/phosphatidylglycerophosphate/cardiolipin synthase-like enzyme